MEALLQIFANIRFSNNLKESEVCYQCVKGQFLKEWIGVKYGEGFLVHRYLGIATFSDVFR